MKTKDGERERETHGMEYELNFQIVDRQQIRL